MKIWSILLIFYLNVNVDSYGLRIRLKIFFRHDNPQDYIYDYSGESSEECTNIYTILSKVGSHPKYSAIPAHTPAIIRLEERVNFFSFSMMYFVLVRILYKGI